MGGMACETTILANQSPVQLILSEGFIDHFRVASPTQFIPRAFNLERGRGGRGFMALIAHFTQDGTMDISVHDGGLFRPVGIVAGCTARLCDRVIAVLSYKRRFVCLVAVCAQCGNLGFQKMAEIFRRVRIMAVQAPLFHRRVFKFCLRYRLPEILVTTEAEFIPRFYEVPLVVRRMWIMATGAFPFNDDLMRAFRFFRSNLLMAALAYPGGIGLQQFSVGGGMGVVATGTIPLFYGCMKE